MDTFLTDDDFTFQSNNDLLKEKAKAISDHTSLVLLDLDDEDIFVIEAVENMAEGIKLSLLSNTDKISQLSETDNKLDELNRIQSEFLNEWKKFGLTEGLFENIYNIENALRNELLSDIDRERGELLLKIFNEQKTLVIAFNVAFTKNVILDIDDYM